MPHRLSLTRYGKHRKQRATDYSVTINGLMTRRSLLLTERPDTLSIDLDAIDHVLNLLDFKQDPQQFMPARRKRTIFKKGEKIRLIRRVLKQADRPLTSREICLAILADKDFDFTDKRRLNQTTAGVYNFLRRECEAGLVYRVEGWPARWVKTRRAG